MLRKPIPPRMRSELSEDPYMTKCCLNYLEECDGRIEWHHNLIYASKRVNEKWCILPVCHYHHTHESENKNLLNQEMVRRASFQELAKYSKAIDYVALKRKVGVSGHRE